jgi:hypothetical protein|tara:strand:+ start:249 stop:458 length:210 start_codon:yes stop_codon:yes gene_type:complete
MDSKNNIILEISSVVESLHLKIASLQAIVDKLCQSTGNCDNIKTAHMELIPKKKEIENGTHLDALCEKE